MEGSGAHELTPLRDEGRAVLLVEGNAPLRAALAEFLEFLGLHVRVSASGEAAIANADPHKVDLLITNLTLPGISGLALADYLHRRRGDLPVIVISSLMEASWLTPRPGIRYVANPFSLRKLRRVVGESIRLVPDRER